MIKKLLKTFEEENNFNNVIVPLSVDVDKVVFVYHHDINKEKIKNCKEVINSHKDIKVEFKKIKVEDVNKYIDKNTTIDVTAAKYLSIVLYEHAFKNKLDVIYYDEIEKVIKRYNDHSIYVSKIFKLSIVDIIKCGGGRIVSNMHKPASNKKTIELIYNAVDYTSKEYSVFTNYVSKINNYLTDSKTKNRSFILKEKVIKKIINDDAYRKYKKLNLFKIEGNMLVFPNNEIRDSFRVSGAFLENYIYHKLLESKQFDDVLMSATIEFNDEQWRYPVTCEIDCLVLKNNNLLLVSIKSNKVDTDDLNEIKVHDVLFGNKQSKPVICINNNLNVKRPSIYAKAEELGVYVVDEDDFIDNKIVDEFLCIINETYRYEKL